MQNLIELLPPTLSENSGWLWLIVIAAAFGLTAVFKIVLKFLSKYLRKLALRTTSIWDDVGVDLIDGIKPFILFILILYLLSQGLTQFKWAHPVLNTLAVVCCALQIAIWGLYIIQTWHKSVLARKIQQEPSSAAAFGLLYTGIRVSFVITLVLISLSNLGINITALLTGLGVGGIAVALAAQNVLGDLLASLSIVLDKPFVVGDFIVAGNEKGTVENIGLKTTRLRSLSGEELIFSNKDLLESRVQNFKRMWVRRVVQKFGVTYSTPADRLEAIPVWVKEIVETQPLLKFDRCHFFSYGSSSLDFELVFFVSDSEYNVYMDLQQKVLIAIFKKFEANKISFAFPTQTIQVEQFPFPKQWTEPTFSPKS